MYDSRYVPTLELHTTISHPLESVRVVGFTGRDTTYGRNAVLLKASEIPTDDSAFGIPHDLGDYYDEAVGLYVLTDDAVLATGIGGVETSGRTTFDTADGPLEGYPVTKLEFTEYDEDDVEITKP